MYKIYSTLFLEQDVDAYNCYVNETLWKRITNELMANRVLIRINGSNKFWICSLGQPIYTSFNSTNHVYVPSWMLNQIDTAGIGEELEVEWFPSDIFDYSTKITLQPHTSCAHIENIQDILSNELTKLAILQKNTTIEVVLEDTDIPIKFDVISVEPASIVLCEGDEVELEFLESFDSVARTATPRTAPPRTATPRTAPQRTPTPYPFEAFPAALYNEEVLSAPPVVGGVKREERYNPWRNKDFKPNTS